MRYVKVEIYFTLERKNMKKINVAIIGAGLMGQKRAEAVLKIPECKLAYVYDIQKQTSANFATKFRCEISKSIDDIINNRFIDIVFLCIRHKDAAKLAPLILSKKNLLLEKPVGRNYQECRKIVDSALKNKTLLFAGFNYHFYPHISELEKTISGGNLGEIISSRFVIGHAAFPGYEKTWKMNKNLCGGGVILDPGIHMIDLMISFFGYPKSFNTTINNIGWKTEVEDEVSILFKFKKNSFSTHHYSLNFAKNKLEIEIIGTKGVARATGRGGNYGPMKFEYIPRWHWKRALKIKEKIFGNEDSSFYNELLYYFHNWKFPEKIRSKYNTYKLSMKLIDSLFEASDNKRIKLYYSS